MGDIKNSYLYCQATTLIICDTASQSQWTREWDRFSGSKRGRRLGVNWNKPTPNQAGVNESVVIVTDSELTFPLFMKQAEVTPLSQV